MVRGGAIAPTYAIRSGMSAGRREPSSSSSHAPSSIESALTEIERVKGSLTDVIRRQSPSSNSPIENFLLHGKRDPFFRRTWIGPQTAKLIDHLLFVLCHPLALE
jgi:hypothetical protein